MALITEYSKLSPTSRIMEGKLSVEKAAVAETS